MVGLHSTPLVWRNLCPCPSGGCPSGGGGESRIGLGGRVHSGTPAHRPLGGWHSSVQTGGYCRSAQHAFWKEASEGDRLSGAVPGHSQNYSTLLHPRHCAESLPVALIHALGSPGGAGGITHHRKEAGRRSQCSGQGLDAAARLQSRQPRPLGQRLLGPSHSAKILSSSHLNRRWRQYITHSAKQAALRDLLLH